MRRRAGGRHNGGVIIQWGQSWRHHVPPRAYRPALGVLVVGATAAGCWPIRDLTVVVPGWLALSLGVLLGWIAAEAQRVRRRHAASLIERLLLLERERELAAAVAVEAERARIARELHDVVSHNVSVMVIQAGAARQAVRVLPDEAAKALVEVEASGRDAMTELRHMLGLLTLSTDDGVDDLVPQPGMNQLNTLIDRVTFAGLTVEVTIDGTPRPLPPGIDLAAYRIVQEALTNALRYAPDSPAEVLVRYADRYLRLEILNAGPSVLTGPRQRPAPPQSSGPGRGLLGLQQRVALYGGHLDARRRLGGGFRVRARIPLGPL